ncbi:MAG: YIP1 family protein [Gammaproteobacteria bacterium]
MIDPPVSDDTVAHSSAVAQLGNLFVAPAQALDYADRRPGMLWLPFGITLALDLALGVWVSLTMNLAAFHAMIIQAMSKANPEHASQAIQMITQHGRGYLLIGAIVGVVGLAIIELLFALYLFLCDKLFSADSRGYGRWFSFTAWTWLPISLGLIAAMIAWAVTSHGTGTPPDVTSLNSLIFHFEPGDRYYKLAQFSILDFWVIGLVAYGLTRWCRHGVGKALAIALAPFVVVYGIIFLV